MLSEKGLRLVVLAVRHCSSLSVIPYEWDKKSGRLVLSKSQVCWVLTALMLWIHQIFLFFVVIRFIGYSTFDIRKISLYLTNLIGFSISCVQQLFFVHKKREILVAVNHYLGFCDRIKNSYLISKSGTPVKEGFENILRIVRLLATIHPFFTYFFNVSNPSESIFVSSYFSLLLNNRVLVLFTSIGHLWMASVSWATALFFVTIVAIYVYTSIFLTSEMTVDKRTPSPSSFLLEKIRQPACIVHTYRSLQVLSKSYMLILRDYILIAINNIVMAFVVINIFVLVRFVDELDFVGRMALLSNAILMSAYLFLTHVRFGMVNEKSRSLIHSWRHDLKRVNPRDRLLFNKYLKSCMSLRIEMSSFGHFRKVWSLRIVGKFIYFSSKFLLTFRG